VLVVPKKRTLLILLSTVFLSSCSIIPVSETPQSWGEKAGKFAAADWKKNHPGEWPTTNSVALYCVNIAGKEISKFDWDYSQQIVASDSCISSFVNGIS